MVQPISILTFSIPCWIVLSLLFIFLSSSNIYAQLKGVQEGDRVRITAPTVKSTRIKGTVSSISPGMVTVNSGDTTLFISKELIQKLEIATGKKRNTGKGAIIGAVSGGLILGIAAVATNEPCEQGDWCFIEWSNGEAFGLGALFGALGGGLNGAIIGTFIKTDRWEEIPVQVSMRPVSFSKSYLTMEPVISIRFKF